MIFSVVFSAFSLQNYYFLSETPKQLSQIHIISC